MYSCCDRITQNTQEPAQCNDESQVEVKRGEKFMASDRRMSEWY